MNHKISSSKTKIIFITGGVMSSLGKGVTASIVALLLKKRGFKVKIRKLEPYLNVDAGTLSPDQHGEVFVTSDGTETDMDIGNYERFTEIQCTKHDYITSGQIFSEVIQAERKGDYLGQTVQIVPHVTDKIREQITASLSDDVDFLICEIGGTVGDMEGLPFLTAIRKISHTHNVMYLHLGLMPFLESSQEYKTKPIQHSILELQRFGIKPDMLLCRSTQSDVDDSWKKKIASCVDIDEKMVLPAWNQKSLNDVIYQYHQDKLDSRICEFFNVTPGELNLPKRNEKQPNKNIKVALITKYNKITDSYCSVIAAIKHAALNNGVIANVEALSSEDLDVNDIKQYDGIIVPGGFGVRGIDGKLDALKFVRENNIPCLGICLGMQLMVIEALRNLYNIQNANSSEFEPGIAKPAVGLIDECMEHVKGGTMRLGSYPCKLSDQLLEIYNQNPNRLTNDIAQERHRHRYEVNHRVYQSQLEQDFNLSAWSPDNAFLEGFNHKTNNFYVGVQFHPEFQTYESNPHPLFMSFIKSCIN